MVEYPPPSQGADRRRIIVPLVLLAIGGLLIWRCAVWARDQLDVHRVTPPAPGAPALILLHGYGAPGTDLVGLGRTLSKSLPGVQILVPEGPFRLIGSGRAWYVESPGEAVESRALLGELFDQLIEEGTAPGDIVVAGFSQGATMAVDVGLFRPDAVGCVGVLSGRIEQGLGWERPLGKGTTMEVLVTHGRKDRTIGFADGNKLADVLEQAGATVTFVELAGGHEITDEAEAALVELTARCVK